MVVTYDPDTLQEINDNVDLLEYVSQSMELERRGKDYWGHCPLHVDKTPSFSITPGVNRYYCFSCKKAGGVIGYLMDYEGLKFDEAVEKAAALANVDLNSRCKSETMSFLKHAKRIFTPKEKPLAHPILEQTKLEKFAEDEATEWLDEGISQEVMDLFGVRIDLWGNRIVYPVYDIDNNLINIKGRTRYPNYKQLKIPKYINYYEVGTLDYLQGLNVTLPYVKEKNEIIIFESLKSVMKAYQWGYKNCAAAETSNLSDEQILLLIKLHVNVVLAFDSDVDYWDETHKKSIDRLKRITNVYITEDRCHLLGGADTKNAPVDLGEDIWNELYSDKRKVV